MNHLNNYTTKYYIALVFITLAILLGCKKEDSCINCISIGEPRSYRLIDSEPTWSPDGQWIAFYHSDSNINKSGMYLITPDGENIRKWHDGFPQSPTWSADSKWIAFSEGNQIWKKNINGDSLTQLTFDGRNFFPAWSPDGNWIAFDRWIPDVIKFYGIWKMDQNGNQKKMLRYDENEGDMRMPSWMNNSNIIYVRYSPQFYSTEIFITDTIGEIESRLTFNSQPDYYPKYFNNKIAFTSISENAPQMSICTMNVDGSSLNSLTNTLSYGCDWSPDGQYLVYTDARYENGRLWIMNSDGSNKHQLTYEYHFDF